MKSILGLGILVFACSCSWAWQNEFVIESVSPHEVQLLETGMASLEKRLDLIESAQKSIRIGAYIFACTDVGKSLLNAIIDRKKYLAKLGQSLEVQILVDSFSWLGDPGLNPFVVEELNKYGIQVKYYNKATYFEPSKLNHRNHQKVFIVDDEVAIVGGRNTADDFFDAYAHHNFLDREVFVRGPIVNSILAKFRDFYDEPISEYPTMPEFPKPLPSGAISKDYEIRRRAFDKMYQKEVADYKWKRENAPWCLVANNNMDSKYRTLGRSALSKMPIFTSNYMAFVADTPGHGKARRAVADFFNELVWSSKTSIEIENLTYLPDSRLDGLFLDALGRGVSVELLTNGFLSRPEIVLYTLSLSHQLHLLKAGAKILGYNGKYIEGTEIPYPEAEKGIWAIHTKSAIFDDQLAWVGSFNLDNRSIFINAEDGILIGQAPEFLQFMKSKMKRRAANGLPLTMSGEYEGAPPMWSTYTPEELNKSKWVRRFRWLLEPFY